MRHTSVTIPDDLSTIAELLPFLQVRILPRQHNEARYLTRFQNIEVRAKPDSPNSDDPAETSNGLTMTYFSTLPRVGVPYTGVYTLPEQGDHKYRTVGFNAPEGVVARFLWVIKTSDAANAGFYLELKDVRIYAMPYN